MDRLQFLTTAASLATVSVAACLRQGALAAPADTTAPLNALFAAFMDERHTKTPQQLTSLGLDKDRYIDTGLHAKGWSREQAIDYRVENTGDNRNAMTTEVERYCTGPGQACSYKVGHSRWLKIREAAGNRLGTKFDLRAFHDAGLAAAPMPMAVLERVMDEWARSQGA